MRFSKIFVSALIVMSAFASCKKDSDNIKNTTIEGRWIGEYINEASGDNFYYSFNIKAGGVFEEIDASGEKIGEGSWEMENNILTAHYKWLPPYSSTYSVLGAFYKDSGKLLGNWGYGSSTTNGGTWQMQKSN